MTAPRLPSPRVRQRLAETIVTALREPRARQVLATLGRDARAAAEWLGPDEAHQCDAVMARARRATAILIGARLRSHAETLSDALEAAALLFDAGLFFEAHEVLEPHWRAASGNTREALQGLIQIAIGCQHRVNGNAAGARSLLREGLRRLRGRRLLGTALDAFAERAARAGELPGHAQARAAPAFPRGWR